MLTHKLVWISILLSATSVHGFVAPQRTVPIGSPNFDCGGTNCRIYSPSSRLIRRNAATQASKGGWDFGGIIPLLRNSLSIRRLTAAGSVMVASFFAYLFGTAVLNRTVVARFGVSRGGDAFGPFATLISLIYSIVLGQIYHYYFERQQQINDCLYAEATALQLLFHAAPCPSLLAYTREFYQTAFSEASSRILHKEPPGLLVEVAKACEDDNTQKIVAGAVQATLSARALRISHVNSELPAVQSVTARLLSYVILVGFVLVDLKAPVLEASLFAVISGCFTTIHGFLMDLSDPFTGQWLVGKRLVTDLEDLIQALENNEGENDSGSSKIE